MLNVGIHGGPVERLTDELVTDLRALGSIAPGAPPSFLDALAKSPMHGVVMTLMDTVPELVAAVKERIQSENGVLPLQAFNAARRGRDGRYRSGSAGDPAGAYQYLTKDSEASTAVQEFLHGNPTNAYVAMNSLAGSGCAISEAVRTYLPEVPVAEFGVIPQVGERSSALQRGRALEFAISRRRHLHDSHSLFRLDNDLLAALAGHRSATTAPTTDLADVQHLIWNAVNSDDEEGLERALLHLERLSPSRPSDGNWLWLRASLPIRVVLSNPVKARVYKASEAFTDVRDFVRLFGGREWIPSYSPGFVDVEDLTPWLLHPIASSMKPTAAVIVTAGYEKDQVSLIQRTFEQAGISPVTTLDITGPAVRAGEIWVYVAVKDNRYLELKQRLMGKHSAEVTAAVSA